MDGLFVRSRVHGSPVSDVFIPIDFVEVPSKSDPSIIHKVKIMFGDTYSCDCKGYKYAGKCWHITQVKEKKEKEQLEYDIIAKKTEESK